MSFQFTLKLKLKPLTICLHRSTETIVSTTEHFSTGVKRGRFLRVNTLKLCTLCDISQKDIVHGSGGLNLQAITLKGGHSERKGTRSKSDTKMYLYSSTVLQLNFEVLVFYYSSMKCTTFQRILYEYCTLFSIYFTVTKKEIF